MMEKEDISSPQQTNNNKIMSGYPQHPIEHLDNESYKSDQENDPLNNADDAQSSEIDLANKNITSLKASDVTYSPESPEFDFESLKASPYFKVKVYPEAIYIGEIKGNKRNGKGIMKYNTSRIYEGDWADDFRSGKGYERFGSNTYVGEFKKSKPWGKGVFKWNNGEVYDGEWYQGLKHGYGIWKGIYGDSYIGEWKNSKADGYGVHTWSNGDRYEGEWKACLKHGNGTDIFSNGDIYIGHYKDGKPDGYGQYIWANGSSYVGYFKDGLKHGKGKWKMKKGTVSNTYEGEYYNDMKQGNGVFRWASGNVYVGMYKNDERDGHGEMIWTDGSKYIGEWKNGIQNGYGKMLFPNGVVKEGYFDNNIFKGKHKPLDEGMVDEDAKGLNKSSMVIEQENLWERYGQSRMSHKKNKNDSESSKKGNGWYHDKDSLPGINMNLSAYGNDNYKSKMMDTTDSIGLKRKQNTVSHTQISFNRGRSKNASEIIKQKYNSSKRPRVSTATTSTMIQNKRRQLQTSSIENRKTKPTIPKFKSRID